MGSGMSVPPENRDPAERPEPLERTTADALESRKRHERLARARAARAHHHPGAGLVLIWFVAAAWVVLLLVHFALWLEGVNEGNWPSVIARPWLVVSVALVVRGRRIAPAVPSARLPGIPGRRWCTCGRSPRTARKSRNGGHHGSASRRPSTW